MNLANRLTLLRIVLVPVFITLVLYGKLTEALVVFTIATITDALDGYIARTRNEKTEIGAVMDPLADKLLIGSAFISFSLVSGLPEHLKIPVYVPVIIISRDVIILAGIASINMIFDKVDIRPTVIGKITTFFQMLTVIALLVEFIYSKWLCSVTVVLTVISGLDYLRIGSGYINGKSE
ncbi:MAG: CDP-alcohol phosphatidyltransferase family protein [Candidatus Omnitrophica bacterium]|nr:CDP-alcohol phosphatidyltransferase family protein [Candidatus Omnitrophota bacterium]MDD5487455.1 CDP-alcohol phosphatidyltransferase family protein [Candidatus Omnitrophota bacterium]